MAHDRATVQTAVRLPREMLAQLRAGGANVSEEIRRRIERTLHEDRFDGASQELANDIRSLADQISANSAFPWYAHPKSYEALTEAVSTWLRAMKPPADQGEADWGPDDPKTLGRLIARTYQGIKQVTDEVVAREAHLRADLSAKEADLRAKLEAAAGKRMQPPRTTRGRKGKKS